METTATRPVPLTQVSTAFAGAVRRLRWAWPVAILVGFPIGGYAANLIVGKIDGVGPALIGGLIAGAIVGAAQWLALRPLVPWLWVVATSIGLAAGLTAGAALVDFGVSRSDLVLMGAVTGLAVGGLQALLLARRGSGALRWMLVNPPAWAVAWLVSSFVITKNVDEHFAVFGASGALVFALVFGLSWRLFSGRRRLDHADRMGSHPQVAGCRLLDRPHDRRLRRDPASGECSLAGVQRAGGGGVRDEPRTGRDLR